jgi:hypothetical protein
MIPERLSMYRLRKDGLMTPKRTWPPTPGYYEAKFLDRWLCIHIYFGPSCDPETGEELDRSPYWHCYVDGTEANIDNWWPECSGREITRDQYLKMLPF